MAEEEDRLGTGRDGWMAKKSIEKGVAPECTC